jgi:hypothetical protein
MRRSNPVLISLGLALLCLAPAGCQEDRLTEATFAQLKRGMTLAEARSVLGSPGELEPEPGLGGASSVAGGMLAGVPGVQKAKAPTQFKYSWREGSKILTLIVENEKVIDFNKDGF